MYFVKCWGKYCIFMCSGKFKIVRKGYPRNSKFLPRKKNGFSIEFLDFRHWINLAENAKFLWKIVQSFSRPFKLYFSIISTSILIRFLSQFHWLITQHFPKTVVQFTPVSLLQRRIMNSNLEWQSGDTKKFSPPFQCFLKLDFGFYATFLELITFQFSRNILFQIKITFIFQFKIIWFFRIFDSIPVSFILWMSSINRLQNVSLFFLISWWYLIW